MLLLDTDCICKIYKSYINNFIKCKKNYIELKNFMFCRKIYDICKNIKVKLDCHIINISNINLKLCTFHDNVDTIYIKKLLDNIENYIKKNKNAEVYNNSINISYNLLNANSFIHVFNLKKNKDITDIILKKYNLKIKRYCCGGEGCQLENID